MSKRVVFEAKEPAQGMTVAELRAALADVPSDARVLANVKPLPPRQRVIKSLEFEIIE